jgi:hypothetical protein
VNGHIAWTIDDHANPFPQPKWYTLNSKRKSSKKKKSTVSGEILLQFSLVDSANPAAAAPDIYRKFKRLVYSEEDQVPSPELDELDQDAESSDEADDTAATEVVEKRRRRLRLARLRRKSLAARAYQFSGSGNGVHGIVFMEIVRVTDLPPERNGMDCPPACRPLDSDGCSSDAHIVRYGSVCCYLSRKKDSENPCYTP